MTSLVDELWPQAPPPATAPAPAAAVPAVPSGTADVNVAGLPEVSTGQAAWARGDLSFLASMEATLRRLATSDPKRLAASLANVEGIEIRHNRKGEPYAVIGGKPYALNAVGASIQDFAPPVAAGLAGLVASLFPPLAAGYTGAAAGGAVTSAGLEIANQVLSGEAPAPGQVAVETGLGAAGGLVGQLMSSTLAPTLRQIGHIIDRNGRLTRTAMAALQQAGMSIKEIGEIPSAVLRQADDLISGRRATPNVINRAIAEVDTRATGVPLRRGEASGDLGQLRREVAGQEGVHGPEAPGVYRRFEAGRKGAIEGASERIVQQVAPGAPRVDLPTAGERIRTATKAADVRAKAEVDAAYKAFDQLAKQANIAIPLQGTAAPGALAMAGAPATGPASQLLSRVEARLLQDLPRITDITAPQTKAVLDRLRSDLSAPFTTPDGLEGMRRNLIKYYKNAKDPTDRNAIRTIMREYDAWMDPLLTQSVQGSSMGGQLLGTLKAARAKARDRFVRFTSQGDTDVHGDFVEGLIDGTIRPEDVVDKLLGGKTTFTSAGTEVYSRLQQALGPNDPILRDVKRQAVERIVGGSVDQIATDARGYTAMANGIRKALEGSGSRYAAQLFGEDGLNAMRQLERQLRRGIRPTEVSSYSRTGYDIRTAIRSALQRVLGMGIGGSIGLAAGAATGDPITTGLIAGGGGLVGQHIGEKIASGSARRFAERAVTPLPVSPLSATADIVRQLPGEALARVLPPGLAQWAGETSMFDYREP